MVSHEFTLGSSFKTPPEMLVESQKAVPVDEQLYIPLTVFNRSFRKAHPTIVKCGVSAVRMSMYQPFGFMSTGGVDYQRSQKTDGLVIEDGGNGLWVATINTPEEPTGLDVGLFQWGVSFYAAHAEANLAKNSPSHSTQSSGEYLQTNVS